MGFYFHDKVKIMQNIKKYKKYKPYLILVIVIIVIAYYLYFGVIKCWHNVWIDWIGQIVGVTCS